MSKCEENFCENFQSAICLHCMHRLCIYHIEDHQNILFNEIDELKNQVNQINIILSKASKMIVEECKIEENKCKDWRKEKIDQIEREYDQMINSIKTRQKTLEQLEVDLHRRVKMEIEQPLELITTQKSVNSHSLQNIQSSIETVKQDSDFLTWNSKQSNDVPNCNSSNEDRKESTLPKVKRRKVKRPKEKKITKWKPRNLLFSLFRDVGPKSADKINEFIQTMMKDEDTMENSGLITLIFSYLQTWHQTKAERGKHKQLILTRHILTVKEYIIEKDDRRKVLLALQFFFDKLKQKDPTEIEMMTMLLQLFFDHQCIVIEEMIDWYLNENFADQIIGKILDKKWAEPFLNLHGYQIKSTDISSNSVETSQNASTRKHVRIRKPFKNLVKLFQNQSDSNDQTIHQYVEMQYEKKPDQRVIMIVRCYLKGWNDCELTKKNEVLLNNLSIIEYYKSDTDFEMQILFAIEIFLSENKKNENWSIETISMLFQLFIDQNLIKKETFLKWNSDGHSFNRIYYDETKYFAQTFIQQLITSNQNLSS